MKNYLEPQRSGNKANLGTRCRKLKTTKKEIEEKTVILRFV
jgi:hypothetical protein